tara:strand:- start:222 stop:842 length:621 start_codon:yes stop_codon:yes gene_type:complete
MPRPKRTTPLGERSTQAIANAARFGSGIGSLDIDRAWSQHGPGHGNLPNKFKGPLSNNPNYLGEPIHNPLFNINRHAPNLKWFQKPMDKGTHPFVEFYHGQPRNYFPPVVPNDPSGYDATGEGTSDNIMMQMDELRDMGEMDFVGSLDQVWGNEPLEGGHHYPHITDYYNYLNTLSVDQLQGIESLMDAKRMNAGRNKKWWAQSDI